MLEIFAPSEKFITAVFILGSVMLSLAIILLFCLKRCKNDRKQPAQSSDRDENALNNSIKETSS